MKTTKKEKNIVANVHSNNEWCIGLEKEEFEITCRARLYEEGFKKESDVDEFVQESVEYCNTIRDTALSAVEIKNLQDALRDEEKGMTVIDLVGFINVNNSKGVYKIQNEFRRNEFKKYYSVSISDANIQAECLPIFNPKLKALVDKTREISKKWIIRGFFLPMPKKGNQYDLVFYVLAIYDYKGTYKSYGFNSGEITYAKELIVKNKTNLSDFIFKNLRRYFKIKKLKENTELKKCIEFAILQALSSNEINSKNGRLHSIIWGSPSSGKNFIVRIIELLNLEYREGQSGKLTAAGLLGACNNKNGKYVSEAGLLPLALYGTFVIQDFHSLESSQKNNFFGIASKPMQDGKAIDSTSAKATYLVQTAIHLDANKSSDVKAKKDETFNFDEEFGVLMHILTRFDFIMNMSLAPKLQFETSHQMLNSTKIECKIQNPERIFKLIIAMLREEFPVIEINDEVRIVIQDRLSQLYKDNKEIFETNGAVAMFQNRLTDSMIKILHSIARLSYRDHSLPEDVDYMMSFLEPKISFLKHFDPYLQVDSLLSQTQKIRNRQKFIISEFGDDTFTIKDVLLAMKSSQDFTISRNISERTVRRYLENIAMPTNKTGEWRIKKISNTDDILSF